MSVPQSVRSVMQGLCSLMVSVWLKHHRGMLISVGLHSHVLRIVPHVSMTGPHANPVSLSTFWAQSARLPAPQPLYQSIRNALLALLHAKPAPKLSITAPVVIPTQTRNCTSFKTDAKLTVQCSSTLTIRQINVNPV